MFLNPPGPVDYSFDLPRILVVANITGCLRFFAIYYYLLLPVACGVNGLVVCPS